MTPAEAFLQQLAQVYWRGSGAATAESSDLVTFERVWDLVEELRSIPGLAGHLVAALADCATTEDERAFLAAGPLEDLLRYAQMTDLNILASWLPRSAQLQDCLHRVNDPTDPAALSWLLEQRRLFARPGERK